jgi:hypothetical protein
MKWFLLFQSTQDIKMLGLPLIWQCVCQLHHLNHYGTGFKGQQCSNPCFTQVVTVNGIRHYKAHLVGIGYFSSIQHQYSDKLFVLSPFLTTLVSCQVSQIILCHNSIINSVQVSQKWIANPYSRLQPFWTKIILKLFFMVIKSVRNWSLMLLVRFLLRLQASDYTLTHLIKLHTCNHPSPLTFFRAITYPEILPTSQPAWL